MSGNIYLIGFMGVGKTTISKYLQKLLEWEEIDTDQQIVEQEGMSITDIFAQKGEEYFRSVERHVIQECANAKNKIVSCGGGVILSEQNRVCMKNSGTVVLLSATPQTIYTHVKDDTSRPLLKGNMSVEYIGELLAQRQPMYELARDITIITDGKTPNEIAHEIWGRVMERSNS